MGSGCSTQEDITSTISVPSKVNDILFLHHQKQLYRNHEYNSTFFDSLIEYFQDNQNDKNHYDKFYQMMANKMGQLYTATMIKIEEKMIASEGHVDDLKVGFSKIILLQVTNMIGKLQSKNGWKNERTRFFKNIAQKQKKIIEFLKFKYPRNKKAFVPNQLDQIFQSMDDSQHTDYDLLINSGINFDLEEIENHGKKYIVSQIKIFINKIVDGTNHQFQNFRLLMQNIFDCMQGKFKIGRKLSQNVGKYTQISSQNIEIYSPQIFRVIIKWIGSMDDVFLNSLISLNSKKYLKVCQQSGQQFNYFPLYTSKGQIISVLTSELEILSKQYRIQQQTHQTFLANFNDTIIKIVGKKSNIPEIDPQEIKTIKYSRYISKFIEFLAIEKLVYLITQLTKLRKIMDQKIRKSIDLIQCSINDLLRAQFMGGKGQLIKIYKKIVQLHQQGSIKIIRIKNRFDTPLNDALINFQMIDQAEKSFLVCEIQLILKIDNSQTNSKQKVYQKVNHVLYELERSIFGPMAQMSLLLTHHDTRMGYEKKIKMKVQNLKKMRCPEKQILSCEIQFSIPYVCSLCCIFYHINQNSFPIYRCQNCNYYVCPSCLFFFDPDIEKQCYQKQLTNYFKENIHQLDENQEYQFFFFQKKYIKMNTLAKQNKNIFDILEQKMILQDRMYVFILKFESGMKHLKCYSVQSGLILPTFYQYLPRSERKQFKNQKFSSYDIAFFLSTNIKILTRLHSQFNLSSYYLTKLQISTKKLEDIFIFKWQKNIYTIDVGQLVRDLAPINQQKPNAQKLLQMKKIMQKYKHMQGRLELDYLDLNDLNLDKNLISNLRFAKISNNRLREIKVLLKFNSIQEIDVSRNDLSEVKLQIPLPKLRIIDLSENYIENIYNFTDKYVPNLKQIRLKSNHVQKMPDLQLKRLLWLNIDDNKLNKLQQLQRGQLLPKLRKLQMNKNKIKQIPDVFLDQLLDIELQQNEIVDISRLNKWYHLKNIMLSKNCITHLTVMNFIQLKELDLSENKIHSVQQLAKSQLPQLKILNISSNLLQNLPKISFLELKQIDLSHNQILEIIQLSKSELPYLENINLAYNKLTQLSNLQFEELLSIDCSHNLLNNLDSIVHSNIPLIQKMDFSNNQIISLPNIELNCLSSLNLQYNLIKAFQNFKDSKIPKLKTLKLAHNMICQFLSADFTALEQLDLRMNRLQSIDEIKQQHLQILRNFQLHGNQLHSLPIMHLEKVQIIQITNNKISSLQAFKSSTMPNLTHLNFKNNNIVVFPTMRLQSLLILELSYNNIQKIDALAHSDMPELQQLLLDHNSIKQLSALQLKKLVILNLQHNEIVNIDIFNEFNLPQIASINLSYNKIIQLPRIHSASLTELDISRNRIKNCKKFCQYSVQLPKLLSVNFNFNQIQAQLPCFNFISLKKLEFIQNQITSLNKFANSDLPKIDIIKLNGNKIQSLIQWKFSRLKELDLANNQLSNIKDFCEYSQLPRISKLNFSNNKIIDLPGIYFVTITTLNFDFNNIQTLEEFSQSKLPNLQRLYLKKNHIKKWNKQLYLQSLKKLNLSQNQLRTFDNINEDCVPILYELNLRKNKIIKLPKNIQLPYLQKLNLDGNPIQSNQIEIKALLKEANVKNTLKCTLDNKQNSLKEKNGQIIELKPRISLT